MFGELGLCIDRGCFIRFPPLFGGGCVCKGSEVGPPCPVGPWGGGGGRRSMLEA